MNERVDKRFDEILIRELKSEISDAFLDLECKLRVNDFESKPLENIDHKFVLKKANQMKHELSEFIDSQTERIISASAVQ